MKSKLTIQELKKEAKIFAESESKYNEPSLFGVTDGKAGEITGIARVK